MTGPSPSYSTAMPSATKHSGWHMALMIWSVRPATRFILTENWSGSWRCWSAYRIFDTCRYRNNLFGKNRESVRLGRIPLSRE